MCQKRKRNEAPPEEEKIFEEFSEEKITAFMEPVDEDEKITSFMEPVKN